MMPIEEFLKKGINQLKKPVEGDGMTSPPLFEKWFDRTQGAALALTVSFLLSGCGSEGPESPPSSPALSRGEVPSNKTDLVSAPPKKKRGEEPNISMYFKGSAPAPEQRLAILRAEFEQGDPLNPQTLETIYGALNDSDPEIRDAAATWLRIWIEWIPEVKHSVEELHRNEVNRDVWQQTADLLAPRREPIPDEPPSEENNEGNG